MTMTNRNMIEDEAPRWKLKFRTPDGRALWQVTYDGQELWQLCTPTHPPHASGGYSRLDALLRLHNIPADALTEATA